LAGVASASDGGVLDAIRARGKLLVSVKNQGAESPQLHKDPAHFQKRGFELEIVGAIAKRIFGDASKVELKLMPKVARLPAVVEGQVDMAVTMLAITDERRAQVDFSDPYYEAGLAILVRPGSTLATLAHLEGKRVAVATQTANDHGAELLKLAERAGVHLTLVRYPSFARAAAAAADKQVDAVVAPAANIDVYLCEARRGLVRAPGFLNHERYAIAVKKGNSELLQAINATLGELRRSGELGRLAAKWKL
jgi:aspartate/glutamate/glutamine transport system substrate-binding protein